jgi:hypothetical protein
MKRFIRLLNKIYFSKIIVCGKNIEITGKLGLCGSLCRFCPKEVLGSSFLELNPEKFSLLVTKLRLLRNTSKKLVKKGHYFLPQID